MAPHGASFRRAGATCNNFQKAALNTASSGSGSDGKITIPLITIGFLAEQMKEGEGKLADQGLPEKKSLN